MSHTSLFWSYAPFFSPFTTKFRPYTPLFRPFTPLFRPYAPLFRPYTPLFRPYTPLFSPYTPLFRPYTPLFSPYTPLFRLYTPLFSPYTPLFRLYTPLFSPYTPLFRPYTYCDEEGDTELATFALTEDDLVYKIPYIKQAQQMSDREVTNPYNFICITYRCARSAHELSVSRTSTTIIFTEIYSKDFFLDSTGTITNIYCSG
jgi:hypothetical protein